MRPAALAGLAVVLFASHATAAPVAAYRAVVIDPEVKLRAGPSDRFEDTGSLRRGAAVIVERDEGNGWLAVTAPSDSVSWIAATFVEVLAPERPTPKHGIVHVEGEVTLAAGKAGLAQPLDVRREKVPQGTRVLIIGPVVNFGGKKWYPIAPPAGDVRYLPKTAVQFEKSADANFTVRVNEPTGTPLPTKINPLPPAVAPAASLPNPGTVTPIGNKTPAVTAAKPAVNHPLWAQAEAAEREGRLGDADKLYFELARVMNGAGGDHDIANLCYTRIHTLREKKRAANATTGGGSAGVLQPPSQPERGVRPGAPQALPQGDNTGATDQPKWTGPGTLRRSALTPDGTGKPAYALETAPGTVRAYVVAGSGVDLEMYLGKRVNVYGIANTRSGLSKPYVVATAVDGK